MKFVGIIAEELLKSTKLLNQIAKHIRLLLNDIHGKLNEMGYIIHGNQFLNHSLQ